MLLFHAKLSSPECLRRIKAGECLCELQSVLQRVTSYKMQIQATLSHHRSSLPLLALTDSGAEGNFLNEALAPPIWHPLRQSPYTARALNGEFLAHVTQCTVPVTLVLSGNHRESIEFNIITYPKTSLVLGHPWLKQHNPHIDWSAAKIVSWSLFCHGSCLRSTDSVEFSEKIWPSLCHHTVPMIAP